MVKWILALLAIAAVFWILGRKRLSKAAATAARALVSIRSLKTVTQILPV